MNKPDYNAKPIKITKEMLDSEKYKLIEFISEFKQKDKEFTEKMNEETT